MTSPEPSSKLPTLRLRITPTAEWKVRSGHPWIFADSVRSQNRPGAAGELAVIYDKWDNFLAIGLYDPDSPLRVRVLHAGKPQTIDDSWWRARFDAATEKRAQFFDASTTGYRCLHGESDGWPGLVLDRYAENFVLKLYSPVWFSRLEFLANLIAERLHPGRLVLRLSRNLRSPAGKLGLCDGSLLFGPKLDRPVIFLENGLQFEADLVQGQKTGFFLDQRENRARVRDLAKGRRVLNTFSYSGGFSVYAARGGAVSVTDLDISAHALDAARRNMELNRALTSACAHDTVKADAFDWLAEASRSFDLVVLDPPSFAKRESERDTAVDAYGRLARLGIARLAPGGVLVAASCSAHVTPEEFFGAVRQAAQKSGQKFTELTTTGHPPDHPAGFTEAVYLKCIFIQFR